MFPLTYIGNTSVASALWLLLLPKCFFLAHQHFFSSGRGSFLVLSAPGRAGSPPEHSGASAGPGRGPWHVRWGFEVVKNAK